MSDTPRVDAVEQYTCASPTPVGQMTRYDTWVRIDFARQLERELAAMQKKLGECWKDGAFLCERQSNELAAATERIAALERERDALQKRLNDKNDFLSLNAAAFMTKCEQLRAEVEQLTQERDALTRILESPPGCSHAGKVYAYCLACEVDELRAAVERLTRERDEMREYADGAVENHKITLEERNAARAEVERLRFDLRQIRAQQKQDYDEVERLKMLLRDGASDSTPEQHAAWVKRRRAALGQQSRDAGLLEAEVERLRHELAKIIMHTARLPHAEDALLNGLLDSIGRIARAALGEE